jgi:hypothetical protein
VQKRIGSPDFLLVHRFARIELRNLAGYAGREGGSVESGNRSDTGTACESTFPDFPGGSASTCKRTQARDYNFTVH